MTVVKDDILFKILAVVGALVCLDAIGIVGTAIVPGQVVYGLGALAVLAVVGAAIAWGCRVRLRVLRRRICEEAKRRAGEEANRLAASVLLCRSEFEKFTPKANHELDAISRHLVDSDCALARHALASFWDSIDATHERFESLRVMGSHAIHCVNEYQKLLSGRQHTFAALQAPPDFPAPANVVAKYLELLARADQDAEFIIVFEQRRGARRGPTFRDLREAPQATCVGFEALKAKLPLAPPVLSA
jgi:hypothetical protein